MKTIIALAVKDSGNPSCTEEGKPGKSSMITPCLCRGYPDLVGNAKAVQCVTTC